MPGIPNLDPYQQNALDYQSLLKRIQALEQASTFNIPVLDADPAGNVSGVSNTSGINLWMITDGRVRFQDPHMVIHELVNLPPATSNPTSGTSSSGGSTNTHPKPVPKKTYTKTYNATWAQCYNKGGAGQRTYPDNSLYYGQYPDGYNGMNMSIAHFSLGSDLSGATVNWMYFHGTTNQTYAYAGGTLYLGGASLGGSAPGSYSSSFENKSSGHVPHNGQFKIQLGSYHRGQFATGSINSITIRPPNTSVSNYGQLAHGGCYLVANYTK
jgi:hypothetical protein